MFSARPPRWVISTIKTLILSMVIPLVSALPVFVPDVAQAATVGSAPCVQTVGSATGVSVTQVGSDCVVEFKTASSTTWTAPTGVTGIRYLVVGGGAGGDRGQNAVHYGHGGGGGEVKDSTLAVTPSTAYTVTVGAGGAASGVTTNAGVNGKAGAASIFATITANPGQGAPGYGFQGGMSGSGFLGGVGLGNNYPGGSGGGAGGPGNNLDGGPGVLSDITGTSKMYGAGGAGRETSGMGKAFGTNGIAVTGTGTAPDANSGAGGSDTIGGSDSTVGGSGYVVIRYTLSPVTTFNANGATGAPSQSSNTTTLGQTFALPTVGTMVKSGYTFGGWNATTDASAQTFAAGSTYTPMRHQTLYAVWVSKIAYNATTATSIRPIESTTANTSDAATTLSNGKLIPGTPIASGLLFNMNAADSSSVVGSTWYDAARNGTTASLVNAPSYNAKEGYFTVNGSTQYINIGGGHTVGSGTTSYTASVMFKADKPNVDDGSIMSRYYTAGSNGQWIIRQRTNSVLQYWRGAYGDLSAPSAFNEGDINYATITYNGTTMKLYLNGALVSSVATSVSAPTTTTDLILGSRGYNGSTDAYWAGRIYSAQGYSRALNETEVAMNYQAMIPNQIASKTGYTLVGYNTAADGTGTSYGTSSVDLAALPAPYARLLPSNFRVTTAGSAATWTSTTGSVLSTSITGTATTYNPASGKSWGASASFPTLSGGTADGIRLNNPTLNTYTFCAVARYKDINGSPGTQRRIIASNSTTYDWISGFHGGLVNRFQNNAWTYSAGYNDMKWHYYCHSANRAFWDGTKDSPWTYQAFTALPEVSINWGYFGGGETSDWELAEVIIYDQYLPDSQIEQVNRYFKNTYGITGGSTTASAAAVPITTNYASPGNNPTLYAQWGSTITYEGNKQTTGSVPAPTLVKGTGSALAANTGSLARAGYRFDGWNTAADGSGTNYAAGGTYPNTGNITLYAKWTIPTIFPTNIGYVDPASLSPYMRFRAADYDTSTRTWYDSSGNGRSTSLITGTLPTLSTTGSAANGASKSFQVVAGTTATKINFNNPELTNYTLFNVARYVGTNRQRIVQSNDHAQLFGFWSELSGVAYHNGWVTQYATTVHNDNWVLSTDYALNYRSNGTSRGASGGVNYLSPIGINWDGTQTGDFQIAEVLIFDRTLTLSEIQLVEDYLANAYGLTNVTQSKSYPNPKTYYVGAGAGGGLRTETFTATQGLGTKTFTISPAVNGITLDNSTINGTAVVISSLAAVGTYLETITATDQSGATTTFQVNLVVTPYTKFDTSTATTLTTSYGVTKTLRLNTVQGIGTKVFSIVTNPLNHFTIDTSTAGSGYATLSTTGFVKPGTYSVVVGVTDSTTVRSTYTISVTVNQTPLITYPNGTVPTLRTNNLVVHYDITNPLSYSGTETRVADLAGTSPATISTSAPYSSSYGGNLSMTPSNNLSMTSCLSSIASTSVSYFLWINPRGNGVVVDEGNASTWSTATITIYNGIMYFGMYGGAQLQYTLPSLNKWMYIGLTYDGTTLRAFYNGKQVGSAASARTKTSTNCLFLGRNSGNGRGSVATGGDFLFGAMHIYSAAVTETDVAYNYEVTQKSYLLTPATSGIYTINTTAGFAADYSLFTATLGTGNKTFDLSPTVTGITLDTSTANTAILKLGTGIAANGTSAATYLETMTATDSVTGLTKYDLSITVNPAISITASTPTTLSTTFGKVAYDTFTATYGTGAKNFSIVSSAYGSAFTLTPGADNTTLLTVSTSLPAGTYTETITALDSVGATANYILTVIVNAAPTIAGNPSNTVTTTVTKPTTLRIDVLNGTGTRRIGFTSPVVGVTLDTSTLTSNYITLRVESTTPVNTFTFNISVTDSANASTIGSFTVIVNRWPVIGTPSGIVTSNLKVSLSSDTYSGSGAWLDTSGNGKNAALGASASPVKTNPTYTTNSGGVFSLNETTSATTNYMQIPSPGSFETFTVSVWARFSSIPTSGEPCLIADYWPASGKMNYVIGFQSGKIYGRWFANPSWSTNSVAITPVINTWYNITYSVYKSGSNYYSDMFLNGVRAGAAVSAGTTAPASSSQPVNIGKRWDQDENINGQIGGVLIYNRALSDAEILQNFNAQGARFLATNSGTTNYTTTEGINSSLTAQVATDGTSTKTFVLAPTVPGISIDTSTANSYVLNIASTVGATDTNTARTIYETVTATDALSATTNMAYKFTINPPIKETATASSITTTSGIAAWDTFTATLGTGVKTFTLTGSPSTTGFTLTQANNVAVLKVEPTANPGTYYETVTATDEVGATKSVGITVLIRPGPTILGPNTLVASKGVAYRSPAFTVINGSSPFKYSLSSKAIPPDTNTVTGITWDTATMTINLSSSVGSGTYIETLTVIDSYSATSSFVISLTVKDPISITGSLDIEKTYGVYYQQTYNVNNLTSAIGFRTSSGSTSGVCVPIIGTVDSATYEMLTSVGACNWIAPAGISAADYVVAAGGGSGGISRAGGGGGGGVATGSAMPITSSAVYTVSVGAGGAAVSSGRGNNGGNSTFSNAAGTTTYVSAGGGGGGGSMSTDTNISYGAAGTNAPTATINSAGGNGGGGAPNFSNPAIQYTVGGAPGTGTVIGYKGGNSFRCDSDANKNDGNLSGSGRTTGGGGGAGGVGVGYTTGATCPTYDGNAKPNGGAAVSTAITGSTLYFGAGGGGSDGRGDGGSEYLYGSTGRGTGTNGGGSGEQAYVSAAGLNPTVINAASGSAAADNRGGGGGGGISTGYAGGSGAVILKYLTPTRVTNAISLTALSNGSSTTSAQVLLTVPENVQAGNTSKQIVLTNGAGTATSTYTINIKINKAIPNVTVILPGNVSTGKYGNEISLYASVSTDGNVEFRDNGTLITGCESVASESGTATCKWVPNTVATRSITVKLTPTDSTNYDSSTATSSVVVGKADTLTVTAGNESVLYNNGSAITLAKPFTYSGLVSIDTLTAVGMIYTGTANDSSTVNTKTGPTVAGTFLITPDTSVAQLSSVLTNYVGYTLVTGTITVNRIAPTMSLVYATTNTVVYSPNLTVETSTATRSGNGAKSFTSSTLSYCTVDSSTARITVVKAGSCLITMSVEQSANFLSASILDTVTVTKATRTISLTAPVSSLKYTDTTTVTATVSGGALDGAITFTLNNNPGCDIDGLSYVLTAISGTLACTLNATIATGDNYESATTTNPLALTIARATAPIISISAISALDFTPGVRAPIIPTYSVTGFKGTDSADYLNLIYGFVSNPFETFAYSDTRTPIDAGTYSITPTSIVMKSGLISNYETPTFSSYAVNFTINRIAQETVTITNVNGEISVPYYLNITGGNNPNGTVTYNKVSGGCSLSTNRLDASQPGLCVVTVTLSGNRNYLPATSDSITVMIRNYTVYQIFTTGNAQTAIQLPHLTPIDSGTVVAPNITLATPDSGRPGDVIVLTGTHFLGATRVIFNVFTDAIIFNVDDDQTITVEIPAGVIPTALDGIDVVTPGGPSMRFYDFTILP